MTTFAERRAKAFDAVKTSADALLVTAPVNVRYLTGFTGEDSQLLLAADSVFFTDGRYEEQARDQLPDVDHRVRSTAIKFSELLGKEIADKGVARLAVEAAHMTLQTEQTLRDALSGTEFVRTNDVVENVRVRKDAAEIDCLRRAQRLAEDAVVTALRGMASETETALALAMEWGMRTAGANGTSFPLIVASGAHSALPHAEPREVPIDAHVLLVDFGARVDGYCSDATRTYLRDGAPDPLPRVHEAVVRALEAACAAVRPGARCSDVDAAARSSLERDGYAEAFVHATGHGVGLDVHENPRLATTSDDVLDVGMVVTVEPGVYLPGVGGVRVEDLLVVTGDGYENLTQLPRGPEFP